MLTQRKLEQKNQDNEILQDNLKAAVHRESQREREREREGGGREGGGREGGREGGTAPFSCKGYLNLNLSTN